VGLGNSPDVDRLFCESVIRGSACVRFGVRPGFMACMVLTTFAFIAIAFLPRVGAVAVRCGQATKN
jgi:hypothetical protein